MYHHLALVVLFSIVFGSALSQNTLTETTCETQRRNNAGARALLHWDIKCDEHGEFLPLQCTVETPKWCACYNHDGSITQPSRGTKSCECFLARHAAVSNAATPCDIPECDRSGTFKKKQCCARTRKCHCVNPTTGQRTTEPTNNMNLHCA